ncbi:hypothetical protein EVAR_62763_1 [Eumeta japonica]|uniref:Uncharacterized protein n=1 Tax=Eumeta variegata TaxID=151549 RepID=A0A4C1ZJM2_EUMVA|nr:hypothetical protein EVAR_62763_1 [Eumeta japonica]
MARAVWGIPLGGVWSYACSNKAMDNQTAIRMELNKIILLLAMQCIQKLISARQKEKERFGFVIGYLEDRT